MSAEEQQQQTIDLTDGNQHQRLVSRHQNSSNKSHHKNGCICYRSCCAAKKSTTTSAAQVELASYPNPNPNSNHAVVQQQQRRTPTRRSSSTFTTLITTTTTSTSTVACSASTKTKSVHTDRNNNNINTNQPSLQKNTGKVDVDWYYFNLDRSGFQNRGVSEASSSRRKSKKSQASNEKSNSPTFSINCEDIEIFNRLSKAELAVDNKAWLSEKPISVLQLDAADRAVLKIADQRDKIQKKTFTKWMNKHLRRLSIEVAELFEDLQNGLNLIYLLEILAQTTLKKERGALRFHSLQNVQTCLNFLTDNNVIYM